MATMGHRLKEARIAAGYPSARQAAERHHWKISSYSAHENGQNKFGDEDAKTYGRAFSVSAGWLLTGEGPRERQRRGVPGSRRVAPLVGYVGAGSEATFFNQHQMVLDEVPAPEGASDTTVAVEIRGESLGALFDRWLVFYDDVRRPVTEDLVGQLCVIGTRDGRVLIKKIQRSRAKGLFHLISNTDPPIFDVAIEWAARVKHMVPR